MVIVYKLALQERDWLAQRAAYCGLLCMKVNCFDCGKEIERKKAAHCEICLNCRKIRLHLCAILNKAKRQQKCIDSSEQ